MENINLEKNKEANDGEKIEEKNFENLSAQLEDKFQEIEDILKESPLWETLSKEEQADLIKDLIHRYFSEKEKI